MASLLPGGPTKPTGDDLRRIWLKEYKISESIVTVSLRASDVFFPPI